MQPLYFLYRLIIHTILGKRLKSFYIHSPFLYNFIINVLERNSKTNVIDIVLQYQQKLISDKSVLNIKDLGAGAKSTLYNKRSVCQIARYHGTNPKNGKMLSQLVDYYNCSNILEFGTSLGIGTAYLALGGTDVKVTTIEGDGNLSQIAQENLQKMGISNCSFIHDSFDNAIENKALFNNIDLYFIDGNHRYDATIKYFTAIIPFIKNDTIVIIDDIHWSQPMYKAWKTIKSTEKVTMTIELYQMGIVFFKRELSNQNFKLLY